MPDEPEDPAFRNPLVREPEGPPEKATRIILPDPTPPPKPVSHFEVLRVMGERNLEDPFEPEEDPSVAGLQLEPEITRPRFDLIIGTAGTGKTFLAREIAQREFGAELCATTGIAAVNLGAGVTTLNSKLAYFDTASLRDLWTTGALARRLVRLYDRGVSRLIVDEVSMMDGDQLLILCYALDEMAEQTGKEMGLTLVGDFCQLPPVKAPFAFEVDAFTRFRPNITKLETIRRQTDLDFIEALQAVRRGDRQRALSYFGSRLQRVTDPDYPGPTILAKNAEVDRFNLFRHAKLGPRETWQWKATRWGRARGEWKLIPETLELKEGALVMVLANLPREDIETGRPTGDYLYVNGDLGEVLGAPAEGALAAVKLRRTGAVVHVQPVTRENLIPLDKERRKFLRAEDGLHFGEAGYRSVIRGSGEEYEAVGGITYMPIRLAYATTVHKSQGLTLDDVQVSIVDHFWESPGMTYVALSRARTSGGMRIVGSPELFMKRITVDPRVREWI